MLLNLEGFQWAAIQINVKWSYDRIYLFTVQRKFVSELPGASGKARILMKPC